MAQAMIIYRPRPNYWTPYDRKTDQNHRVEKRDRQLTAREMEGVGLESPTLNSGVHMRHINDIRHEHLLRFCIACTLFIHHLLFFCNVHFFL
ncbi:conserved hypothetical protein [Ricinus communis]|uniref:Uncharacterized protein n=1 Tax=Ricinus communis TaxID=3988 RepID=B9S338_RICCO|nr:conserved hypothetical protein [Ricinus communis]